MLANLTPPQSNSGPKCRVCILLEQLPREEGQALDSMLRNSAWQYSAIADAVAREAKEDQTYLVHGAVLGQSSYARHANGRCTRGEVYR